jgi:hypothetical protein
VAVVDPENRTNATCRTCRLLLRTYRTSVKTLQRYVRELNADLQNSSEAQSYTNAATLLDATRAAAEAREALHLHQAANGCGDPLPAGSGNTTQDRPAAEALA